MHYLPGLEEQMHIVHFEFHWFADERCEWDLPGEWYMSYNVVHVRSVQVTEEAGVTSLVLYHAFECASYSILLHSMISYTIVDTNGPSFSALV